MFHRFSQRSNDLERLDRGDYTAAEYALWQREMRWIHGVFGEVRALDQSLVAEIRANGPSRVSILDVGAAWGYLLAKMGRRLDGISTTLVAADLELEGLRSVEDGVLSVQCSGLQLPFANDSFDHAVSTLTFHHLGDEDAVEMLKEMSRVARRRIYIIDLNRHPVAYYLFRLVSRLFLQKLSREDGALSILRSRTPDELREIGARAGLADIKVAHSRINRLVLSGK